MPVSDDQKGSHVQTFNSTCEPAGSSAVTDHKLLAMEGDHTDAGA
jgi:hypothetical protein